MADASRDPREHWLKWLFGKNEVEKSGYTIFPDGGRRRKTSHTSVHSTSAPMLMKRTGHGPSLNTSGTDIATHTPPISGSRLFHLADGSRDSPR